MVLEAVQGLTLYVLDILPHVSAEAYWRTAIGGSVIEGFVKFAVVWELFATLIHDRPSVAKLGIRLIVCTGAVLAALAALAAAQAPIAHFAVLSYFRLLEQTIYLIEAGVMLFIFFFAAYFRLEWKKSSLGIALGLSLSACVGLGVFAVCAGEVVFKGRYLLDILDMGTYHVCVLIWFYYLLSPGWPSASSFVAGVSGAERYPTSSPLRKLGPDLAY